MNLSAAAAVLLLRLLNPDSNTNPNTNPKSNPLTNANPNLLLSVRPVRALLLAIAGV